MFAFYATVRQPCSYYVTYSKLSRFYTTFQMDHYDAGSDRGDFLFESGRFSKTPRIIRAVFCKKCPGLSSF